MRSLILLVVAAGFIATTANADTKGNCNVAWKKAPDSYRAKHTREEFLGMCTKPKFTLKDYGILVKPILSHGDPAPEPGSPPITFDFACFQRCQDQHNYAIADCENNPGPQGSAGCICEEKEYYLQCQGICRHQQYSPKLELCVSP
jgi:hypothetical protein